MIETIVAYWEKDKWWKKSPCCINIRWNVKLLFSRTVLMLGISQIVCETSLCWTMTSPYKNSVYILIDMIYYCYDFIKRQTKFGRFTCYEVVVAGHRRLKYKASFTLPLQRDNMIYFLMITLTLLLL